jgi:hypothetical protein
MKLAGLGHLAAPTLAENSRPGVLCNRIVEQILAALRNEDVTRWFASMCTENQ